MQHTMSFWSAMLDASRPASDTVGKTEPHAKVHLGIQVQNVVVATLQAAAFGQLNKAKLGVWEALQQLNGLEEHSMHDHHTVDQPQISLFDHAVQTAELCRLAHPQQDWLHLVGLIHSLGKLMALPRFEHHSILLCSKNSGSLCMFQRRPC